MEKYDVIIIGSGLGGLACGFILAKNGLSVCILEQDARVGGCLRTFRRGEKLFDTGFHYVGGLDEGQSLHRLFHYFGLLDLPWHKLDEDAFDEVIIGDQSFMYANGHTRFAEQMGQYFPNQRKNLIRYTSFLKNVGDNLFKSFNLTQKDNIFTTSLFARSAYDFLNETIDDPLLRKVLSGTSLKMELNAEKLPLYIFFQINNSYIESAWRLHGGGSQIADTLADHIRNRGGNVLTRSKVTRLKESGGQLSVVEVNGEKLYTSRWVISNAHPAYTISLIDETKLLRKIYRKRIASIENTYGIFTVNIGLKPGTVRYRNRNIFIHKEEANLWHYDPQNPLSSILVSFNASGFDPQYASNIDLLTPMTWNEVAKWKDTPVGHRGSDYVEMKNKRTEACLSLVSPHIPGLRAGIDKIYTSTPLSYRSYTNTVNGSAYGIRKDYTQPMYTVLAPRTPIPNLLLTGQNLNLHGILGVSVTSFFTCAEILGMKTLLDDLQVSD